MTVSTSRGSLRRINRITLTIWQLPYKRDIMAFAYQTASEVRGHPEWVSAWSAYTRSSSCGHTRSSVYIIRIGPTDRSFQYASLVSGINSCHLSVNHSLISPILTHPVLWVALRPSVPSTHHSHHPLPLYSPGLISRIPRTVYRYFWAYPFLVFSFFVFHFLVVGSVR